ncbi:MAG: hypothetical protein SFX74_10425 [Fimbriimonadaceae bacterium]|nr:hypothetical protein [Fimbriimonadaceae bacterium]
MLTVAMLVATPFARPPAIQTELPTSGRWEIDFRLWETKQFRGEPSPVRITDPLGLPGRMREGTAVLEVSGTTWRLEVQLDFTTQKVLFDGRRLTVGSQGHHLVAVPDFADMWVIPKLGFNLPGLRVYGRGLDRRWQPTAAVIEHRARRADRSIAYCAVPWPTEFDRLRWVQPWMGAATGYAILTDGTHLVAQQEGKKFRAETWRVRRFTSTRRGPFTLADTVRYGNGVQYPGPTSLTFDRPYRDPDAQFRAEFHREPPSVIKLPKPTVYWQIVAAVTAAFLSLLVLRRWFRK